MPLKKPEESLPVYPLPKDTAGFLRTKSANMSLQKMSLPEVVFIGDSITQYWSETHPDFFFRNNFASRGVCGETSDDILKRFQADAVESGAEVAVLLCGINDLLFLRNSKTLTDIWHNVSEICHEASLANMRVIICSLLPCYDFLWEPPAKDLAAKIIQENILLRSLARQLHVPFADYYSVMADEDGNPRQGLTNDGCHPSGKGFCAMEPVVVRQIETLTNRHGLYYTTPEE